MSRSVVAAVVLAAGLVVAAPAFAQTSDGQTPDGWRFSVTPYLWIAGPEGKLSALPSGPSSEFDVAFKNVLTNLSGAFLGKGEIGYGKFGVIGDIAYVKVTSEKDIGVGGIPQLGAKASVSGTLGLLAAYYRVYDSPKYTFDLLAGANYNGGEISLDVSGVRGNSIGGSVSKDWIDPVVGVRASVNLTPKSSLSGTFDVGGGSNSTSVWQVIGAYNYKLNPVVTLSAGYRYYAVNFENENFRYDLNLGGLLFGATFNF